jgi:hypothetical protein
MPEPTLIAIAALGLLAVGQGLLVFFMGRKPPALPPITIQTPDSKVDLNSAMETVLVKSMEAQGTMLERINRLNAENATLAVDLLQKRSAVRAGKIRARTGKRDAKGRMQANCRLCANPMISDPTSAEIVNHSVHRAGGNVKVTEKNGTLFAHVQENDVLTRPDGDLQVEDDCETCGGKHPTSDHPGGEHVH